MMWMLILQGLLLGVLLAFLIGPVFFVVLDTSITKGKVAAMILDLGVLFSDLFCLVLAYLASKQLEALVYQNPWFFFIGGIIIMGYGVYLFFRPFTYKRNTTSEIPSAKRMASLFSKGFLLNIVNPGVIIFWVTVVLFVGSKYDFELQTLTLHFGATFLSFALCDLLKIFGAEHLKKMSRPRTLFKFQRALAGGLVLWGLIVLLRGL